jgi:hypothetical protein
MFPQEYRVSDFRQWVCERIRGAVREDEKAGWAHLDAWINRRIATLSRQRGHAVCPDDYSAYYLIEGLSDE